MTDSFFGDAIYSYSRANAIADGSLVDVTEQAQLMGFKVPVALTSSVWQDCVLWTGGACPDQTGRLRDVLWMAFNAAKETDGNLCIFEVARVPRGDLSGAPSSVQLKMLIGPGDDPRPVITIMQPFED